MDSPGVAGVQGLWGAGTGAGRGWQAVSVRPNPEGEPAADAELRALLAQLKDICGLSYDKLAAAAAMSRNSVLNYVTKPGHRRDARTLEQLLTALEASPGDRGRALELHRRTLPSRVDAAEVGWTARARCTTDPSRG